MCRLSFRPPRSPRIIAEEDKPGACAGFAKAAVLEHARESLDAADADKNYKL